MRPHAHRPISRSLFNVSLLLALLLASLAGLTSLTRRAGQSMSRQAQRRRKPSHQPLTLQHPHNRRRSHPPC